MELASIINVMNVQTATFFCLKEFPWWNDGNPLFTLLRLINVGGRLNWIKVHSVFFLSKVGSSRNGACIGQRRHWPQVYQWLAGVYACHSFKVLCACFSCFQKNRVCFAKASRRGRKELSFPETSISSHLFWLRQHKVRTIVNLCHRWSIQLNAYLINKSCVKREIDVFFYHMFSFRMPTCSTDANIAQLRKDVSEK